MPQFLVAPAHYPLDEFDANATCMRASTAKAAAEEFVETNLANLDYPKSVEIRTQEVGQDRTVVWKVRVQSVPEACATLVA